MARLGDGTVMVIGESATSYRYNPSTNTFSSVTGSPTWDDPAVATLDNGSVIACRFSCSVYNGSAWAAAASVSTQAMSSATLADGRAMMCLLSNALPESCSIYNRSTNVHSLVSNRPPLLAGGVPQMARLGDGRILMCNSYGDTSLTNQICYAYHPDIDRYSRVADLPVNIANFMMSELSGGQALLCGGSIYASSTWTQTNRCFRFTP
jgi:hypothetical protein